MLTEKAMLNVLLVSKSPKTAEALVPILKPLCLKPVCNADSAARARKHLSDHHAATDLAIINMPLTDDSGLQLAIELAGKNMGVLVLVKNEIQDQVSWQLEPYGIVTLGKPLSAQALTQALKMLRALRRKLVAVESQRSTLEDKMKEIRLVNRAKWLLIGRLSMSEEEANRYIEKTAMDTSQKKKAVAEQIIKMYET